MTVDDEIVVSKDDIVYHNGKEYIMCHLCGHHFERCWWRIHTDGCKVGLWW